MNTAQNTQEKRTIKVKEFLDDFRLGMGDQALQEKYHLTPMGLEKFYGMLMDRGILSPQEIQDHYRGKESDIKKPEEAMAGESSFICPQCLASHQTMFDICPSCGVSFQDMINEQRGPTPQEDFSQGASEESGNQQSEKKSLLGKLFSSKGQSDSELPASEFCCVSEPGQPKETGPTDTFAAFRGGFDDPTEEIVSGMPYDEPAAAAFASAESRCDGCKTIVEPTLRDVYDRTYSMKVLMASAGCFFLGFLLTVAIHFFSGYSFARLLVVYGTGVFLLFGSVLLAVGTFLFMAKEKVYCCPSCRRVYPRD